MLTFSQLQMETWLAAAFLPFVRILALFSSAPVLSHRSIPVRVRVALAFLIGLLVAPFAQVPAGLSLASATAFGMVAQQVAIGLVLGFSARLLFAVFEIAGEFMGLQMGFSFAGFFDPNGGRDSAIGSWLNTLGMMLFIALNAHLVLLDTLIGTFKVFPIAADPFAAFQTLRIDQLGAEVFRMALVLALPATMLMLFVNLVLGFASRVAPQLSIFSVGFPVTILAGLSILALGTEHLLAPMSEAMRVFLGPLR